jgi:hypothetical protein
MNSTVDTTPSASAPPQHNRDEIIRSLRTLYRPGDVVELRIPSRGRQGLFTGPAAIANAVLRVRNAAGIYTTVNPITRDVPGFTVENDLRRLPKKEDQKADERLAIEDLDIASRRWLPIDIDPQRPTRSNSTDAEHQAAHDLAKKIREHLSGEGWPAPIYADSGNGAHLLYRIDLPNDAESATLVQRCLTALAQRFSTPACEVDRTVYNASRIFKLYGTVAAKAEHTPERPQRLAHIIDAPDVTTLHTHVVSRETLMVLASQVKEDVAPLKRTAKPEKPRTSKRGQASIRDRAIAYLATLPSAVSGQNGHLATYRAACALVHGYCLDESEALEILESHYNPRCDPPWKPKDLERKVAEAKKREHREPYGYLRDAKNPNFTPRRKDFDWPIGEPPPGIRETLIEGIDFDAETGEVLHAPAANHSSATNPTQRKNEPAAASSTTSSEVAQTTATAPKKEATQASAPVITNAASQSQSSTAEKLDNVIPLEKKRTKQKEPPVEPDAAKLPFAVLGYSEGVRSVFVFTSDTEQLCELPVSNLKQSSLLTLAPLEWWTHHFAPKSAQSDFHGSAAISWLLGQAKMKGIFSPRNIRGRGACIDAGRHVYHCGDRLLVDDKEVAISDFASSRFVYTRKLASEYLPDAVLAPEDGKALLALISKFRWEKPVFASIFAGWLALAPICGALKWRPHLFLSGSPGSGKSTIFKFANALLSGGAGCLHLNGNTTEAGIRQELNSDAIPVLFDEAEQQSESEQKRIQNVLGFIRNGSSDGGAKTLKGTQGGNSLQFESRSMFCLAATGSPLAKQADLERFQVLTLRPKNHDRATSREEADQWVDVEKGIHDIIHDDDFRAQFVRRAIRLMPTTMKNIVAFQRAATIKFGNGRYGDQIGTLVAGMFSLLSDAAIDESGASRILASIEFGDDYNENQVSDGARALESLLESRIRAGDGVEYTVADLAIAADSILTTPDQACTLTAKEANRVLLSYGMRIMRVDHKPFLALSNTSLALRKLLKDTPYASDLRGYLLREPYIVRISTNARFEGPPTKSVGVPLEICKGFTQWAPAAEK